MKKTITFLTFEGYNRPSARIRCYNFASALEQRGFQTEVISFVDTLGVDEKQIYDLTDTRKIALNYQALPILLKGKDRVLYVQKVYYHSFAALFARMATGAKLIVDYDDYDFHTPIFRNKHLARFLNPMFVTRKLMKNASAVVAASRYLQNHLEELSENRTPVHLISTGVDSEKFKSQESHLEAKEDKVVFSWTGLVWGEPIFENIVFLMESFSRMQMHRSARLEILGNFFHLESRLEKLIKEKYAHLSIELRQWLPPEAMPKYLSTVHVGLLPLIQDTCYNRSKSPTKLFEYMAAGTPVIATGMGEAEFVVEDGKNGFLVNTHHEMAEKMDILVKDHNLRTAMGKAARQTIEKEYSLKKLGEKLAVLLEEL